MLLQYEDVLDKVRAIVAEELGLAVEKVEASTRFVEDLDIDSIERLELLTASEEVFGFEFIEEHWNTIDDVGSAASYITKVINQAKDQE